MRSPQGGGTSRLSRGGRPGALNPTGLKQIRAPGDSTTWRPEHGGPPPPKEAHRPRLPPTPLVVLVDAVTLLNQDLSPTARLTYAVLASNQQVDEGSDTFDLDRTARAVGLANSDALLPVLAELTAVGVLEDHGLGLVLSVNLEAIPPANQQACVPCDDCGQCSCGGLQGEVDQAGTQTVEQARLLPIRAAVPVLRIEEEAGA